MVVDWALEKQNPVGGSSLTDVLLTCLLTDKDCTRAVEFHWNLWEGQRLCPGLGVLGLGQLSWEAGPLPVLLTGMDCDWAYGVLTKLFFLKPWLSWNLLCSPSWP